MTRETRKRRRRRQFPAVTIAVLLALASSSLDRVLCAAQQDLDRNHELHETQDQLHGQEMAGAKDNAVDEDLHADVASTMPADGKNDSETILLETAEQTQTRNDDGEPKAATLNGENLDSSQSSDVNTEAPESLHRDTSTGVDDSSKKDEELNQISNDQTSDENPTGTSESTPDEEITQAEDSPESRVETEDAVPPISNNSTDGAENATNSSPQLNMEDAQKTGAEDVDVTGSNESKEESIDPIDASENDSINASSSDLKDDSNINQQQKEPDSEGSHSSDQRAPPEAEAQPQTNQEENQTDEPPIKIESAQKEAHDPDYLDLDEPATKAADIGGTYTPIEAPEVDAETIEDQHQGSDKDTKDILESSIKEAYESNEEAKNNTEAPTTQQDEVIKKPTISTETPNTQQNEITKEPTIKAETPDTQQDEVTKKSPKRDPWPISLGKCRTKNRIFRENHRRTTRQAPGLKLLVPVSHLAILVGSKRRQSQKTTAEHGAYPIATSGTQIWKY